MWCPPIYCVFIGQGFWNIQYFKAQLKTTFNPTLIQRINISVSNRLRRHQVCTIIRRKLSWSSFILWRSRLRCLAADTSFQCVSGCAPTACDVECLEQFLAIWVALYRCLRQERIVWESRYIISHKYELNFFSAAYFTVTVLFALSYLLNPRYELTCYLAIYITIMFNNMSV